MRVKSFPRVWQERRVIDRCIKEKPTTFKLDLLVRYFTESHEKQEKKG
jgi:hypothetical protein